MSNTGHKGITHLPDQGVYKVTVGWRGKILTRYVRGKHPRDLAQAIRLRNTVERELGKPRTEEILRASGVAQGKRWRRPIKKKRARKRK
jgi:hypothetical protein